MSDSGCRNGTPKWAEETSTASHNAGLFPVPGSWVLGVADGDGAIWRQYRSLATDEHERERDFNVKQALPSPNGVASLTNSWHEESGGFDRDGVPEFIFEVENREVFRVRDPDYDDVMAAVAEALRAIDDGADFEDIEDIQPDSGETVVGQQEQRRKEIEKRREQNAGLGDFA